MKKHIPGAATAAAANIAEAGGAISNPLTLLLKGQISKGQTSVERNYEIQMAEPNLSNTSKSYYIVFIHS